MSRSSDHIVASRTRRQFLIRAGMLAGASLLAACGGSNAPTATTAPSTVSPTAASPTKGSATTASNVGSGSAAAPTAGSSTAAAPVATTSAGTGASPATAATGGQPKLGGTSTWAAETDPVSLNPITNSSFASTQGFEFSYESLTAYTPDLKIVPALAESWETPNDTTYVFHLRQGVKWHDGTAFTADDVKYTFDIVLDPKGPAVWRQNFDQVDHVEVVDQNTVKFITKAPFPPLLGAFAILRSSAIIQKGAMEKGNLDTTVIGTGPYKMAEYVPKDHLKLVKNKDYWGSPIPYMDEVTFKILQDEDARVAGLRAATIDYGVLSPQGRQRLQSEKNLTISSVPRQYLYVVVFNMNRQPWSDVRVRQAVNLAVDRSAISDKVYSNDFTSSGPIAVSLGGNWALPTDELTSKWFKRDPEQAKQLLKDAGISPNKEYDFLVTAWNQNFPALAVVLADQLKQIGLNLKIRQLESGVYVKESAANNFDVTLDAFTARHDPDGYVYGFHSGLASARGYKNEPLDGMLVQARTTLDPAKRKQLYDDIQRTLLTDNPNVWFGVDTLVEGLQQYVKGYAQSPSSRRIGMKTAWLEK